MDAHQHLYNTNMFRICTELFTVVFVVLVFTSVADGFRQNYRRRDPSRVPSGCRYTVDVTNATPNIVIDLKSRYPHGTTIRYKCTHGHRLVGNRKRKCNAGKWTPVRFKCLRRQTTTIPTRQTTTPRALTTQSSSQCGPPEVDTAIYNVYTPELEQVDVNRDEKYPHGTWLRVDFHDTDCGDGFDELVCANGSWSDTLPECRLECILPSHEYHGGPEFSYYLGNETLREGESLHDNTTVSVTCAIPTPIDYDNYPAEDDDGVTETPIRCLNGTWIGEFPQNCTAGCSHDIANGHVINGSYVIGYHISCDRGYEFARQGTVTGTFNCYDGVWGVPKPDCQPKSCRIPGYTYELGIILTDSGTDTVHQSENCEIPHNDTVTQLCPAGHFPLDRVVRCDFGVWKTAGQTGQGGDEEIMDIEEETGNYMYDAGAVADDGDSDNLKAGGGVIEDDSGIVDTGHTDGRPRYGDFPVCREVTCPTTPPVTRVSYYPEKQKYMYGDNVIVNKCRGKMEFIGQHEISCQGNGTWSGAATCRKFCEGGKIEQIQLHNTEIRAKGNTFNIASFGKCKDKCRRYKRFLCRAITFGLDFRRRWKCILHTQDLDSNPRLLGVKSKWTVVYRKCTEQS